VLGLRRRTAPACGGSSAASEAGSSRWRWRRPGWRFVVEELRRVGARVHLAEPAETAARRGSKKRAKNDRADARHLRELLMAGRLPEWWIPPCHILDLRARVGLRHTLSEQRGEWQQRIQAVLFHHGCPQRRNLMTGEGQRWLAARPLPACAREQVTVALGMIDALDAQLAPLNRELRAYARRQPGCRALMRHYGIGELIAVTVLAELGDAGRFSSSGEAVRYGGMDITVHQSDRRRAPGHLSRQGPPALRWALFEAARSAARAGSPDRDYYRRTAERLGANCACLSIARKLLRRSPHAARARRGGTRARMTSPVRAKPFVTEMRRGRLHHAPAATTAWTALIDRAAATLTPSGITRSTIISPARGSPGPWTEVPV
jgi:transposase